LSADPLGHASDPSLFSFAGGDPVNFFDPDGRLGKNPSTMPDNAWYSTAFGDIKYGPDGITMWSGGMLFYTPYNEFSNPLEGAFDDIHPGQFVADAMLNADRLQQSWQEVRHPDFRTGLGRATFAVTVVGLISGTVDAAANVVTLGGKGLVQGGVKSGIKEVAEVGAKEIAQAAKTELRIAPYEVLKNDKSIAGQAHHLNQNAAYRDVIPGGQGVSTKLEATHLLT